MRSGKRVLAGVAAGALAAGMMAMVGVAPAQAAGTVAGTATPIRFTGTAGSLETTVPAGGIVFPMTANALAGTAKFYFDGTTASNGKMAVYNNLNTGTWGSALLDPLDDTTLIPSATGNIASADDSIVYVKVTAAGRYTGKIANGTDTVTFDFTTAGAPTALSLTPATQSVLVGGSADLTVALLTSTGTPTQPTFSSAVAFANSPAAGGTLSRAAVNANNQANADDTAFALGLLEITDSAMAAGTTSVSATGSGDLLGLSATASVTASGSISDDTVVGMSITSPASGVWNKPALTSNWVAQVKSGTSALAITIDDTKVNTTGNPMRFKVTTTYGSVTSGSQTATSLAAAYVDVTPTSGKGTLNLTLGGAAAVAGNTIVVQQVDVTDAAIDAVTKMTISVVVPVIYESGITVTPSGSTTAKLGDTTSVNFTIDDSLGDPASGQVVTAYRSSVSLANLLSTANTGADGKATVTVTNAAALAAGGSETYRFTVSGIGASAIADQLIITYTASGNITAMTVTPRSASPIDAAGTLTVSTVSAITVPSTTGLIGTTMSTGTYNPTTLASGGTATPVVDFRVATTPNNSFTVTVPEGMKVSNEAPTATTLWSAGSTSVNASYDDSIYVWATKVGTHEYTVTSGGLTVKGKVKVTNSANDAYDVSISPKERDLGKGAISTVTLSLKDMFGNPVEAAGTTAGDDTGAITLTASGEVLLAGFVSTNTYATGADGTVSVTIIAGNSAGTGTLAATAKALTATPAWQATYTPPAGKSKPVTSDAAAVRVSAESEKTIVIVGERGTGENDNRIYVDGLTTGIDNDAKVKPWVRFPGETSYAEGSARPVVTDDEFSWTRKTGKKIYVYFTTEDDAIKSNRIIISAR